MKVNKLVQNIKVPYEFSRGSLKQRQAKADILVDTLYHNMLGQVKDDYSMFTYKSLQKLMSDVLPDHICKISVKGLSSKFFEGLLRVQYDNDKSIRGYLMQLCGISSTIRSCNIPIFIHEFQHLSDYIYNPKYLSRLQSLNIKGLETKRYDKFYDSVYYTNESAKTEQEIDNLMKSIRKKTKKFLRKMNISDKMDYIQDVRYSLEDEIVAYEKQRKIAEDLRAKGFMIDNFDLYDYPKEALFKEKIELLKQLAIEYITKERAKNASCLSKEK